MDEQQTPLAVTLGDPAGAGPLATWGAWRRRSPRLRPFYVIGDPATLEAARLLANVEGQLELIHSPAEAAEIFPRSLPVFPLPSPTIAMPGHPDIASAKSIISWIETAVRHVQSGEAAAVVTNPISKALLQEAGFPHPGHTEFLAHLSIQGGSPPRPVMLLANGSLRVALATIHLPLMQVGSALNQEGIVDTALILNDALRRDFDIASPRIGLCGLNPHAGENGRMGTEEISIINPAARLLRNQGVDISDARPGDTIFHEALDDQFDAVLAMYHDQGLIPVKTLDMWSGVNATLGLPFVRTSPDHGTAYAAAAAGAVRPDSLIAALKLADQMSRSRTRFA